MVCEDKQRSNQGDRRNEDTADTLNWDPKEELWKLEALDQMTRHIQGEAQHLSQQLREKQGDRDHRKSWSGACGTDTEVRYRDLIDWLDEDGPQSQRTPIPTTIATSTPGGAPAPYQHRGPLPPGPPPQGRQDLRGQEHHDQEKGPEPMYPLMDTLTGRPMYVPWSHCDLKGLVDDLPPVKEWAGKWIRTFEQLTTAD